MTVFESLFLTQRNDDDTYSWTLAQWTSAFIRDIEQRFGPRNSMFSLVGVEIDETPNATPCNYFPDFGIPPGDPENRSRHIIIRLTPQTLVSRECARWQLAHECIHLIDPWNRIADGRATNVLEEGLAVWYQNFAAPCSLGTDLRSYLEAEALINPHIGELCAAIKSIRSDELVRIGEMTPELLLAYCPSIGDATARRLCDPFDRGA